jgi:hypothetical protein
VAARGDAVSTARAGAALPVDSVPWRGAGVPRSASSSR